MRISPEGVEFIKSFEGLETDAYQDPAGIWTIGYGHTSAELTADCENPQRVPESMFWTRGSRGIVLRSAMAVPLLQSDLVPRETAVSRLVDVPINQNQFDALVSLVFNIGERAFSGSTARKRLNRGDYVGAAKAMTWWNKATVGGKLIELPGLTRRRNAEAAMFLTDPPSERKGETGSKGVQTCRFWERS